MSLSIFLKLYAVAFMSFLVIDLLWLGVIARSFYRSELGHFAAHDPASQKSDFPLSLGVRSRS